MKMKNGLRIDNEGNKRYYLNNLLHRHDGPAQEFSDGSKFWYLNGEFHRVDGPAQELGDGSKFWFLNDELHRVDGPAEEWVNGIKRWFLNGNELIHPEEFENMEEWFQELNDNEEYSLQWINDFNGIIGFIKEPSGKQTRLNAMRWKI